MIKVLRKYQRTIFGVLVIAAAALAMGGFGLGSFLTGGGGPRGAITVNDTAISYDEVHRQRRELENLYRARFGQNYDQIMKMFNINVAQTVVDQIIANTLLDQELKRMGFAAGDQELTMLLTTRLFPKGVDEQQYQALLREKGLTSAQFMDELKRTLVREQLMGMLSDISKASVEEARTVVEREDTSYTVSCASFDPEKFLDKAPAPDEEKLKAYYEENSLSYELPERVAYDYVIFSPEDFESTVQVNPEDIEAWYTENSGLYELPDEVNARWIRINKPAEKKGDPATEEELIPAREKAVKALDRARTGEDFTKLVTEYSEDAATKLIGGDIGWVKRGKLSKEFDEEAFALKGPGIAELVETPEAYFVVEVKEYKEKQPKPLEQVKDGIEKEIRKREAPTYASETANGMLSQCSKSGKSLKDFAAEKNLKVASSGKLLAKEEDPAPKVAGLTRKILEMPGEEKQVVELKEISVLVGVAQYREVETPPLAEVKEKVAADIRQKEAKELAWQAAQSFFEKVEASPAAFDAEAKKTDAKLDKIAGVKVESPGDLPDEQEVHSAVFNMPGSGLVKKVIKVQGKPSVFYVTEVKKPDPAEVEKKVDDKLPQVSRENAEILMQSIVNRLKAQAKIEVDPILTMDEGA